MQQATGTLMCHGEDQIVEAWRKQARRIYEKIMSYGGMVPAMATLSHQALVGRLDLEERAK